MQTSYPYTFKKTNLFIMNYVASYRFLTLVKSQSIQTGLCFLWVLLDKVETLLA